MSASILAFFGFLASVQGMGAFALGLSMALIVVVAFFGLPFHAAEIAIEDSNLENSWFDDAALPFAPAYVHTAPSSADLTIAEILAIALDDAPESRTEPCAPPSLGPSTTPTGGGTPVFVLRPESEDWQPFFVEAANADQAWRTLVAMFAAQDLEPPTNPDRCHVFVTSYVPPDEPVIRAADYPAAN